MININSYLNSNRSCSSFDEGVKVKITFRHLYITDNGDLGTRHGSDSFNIQIRMIKKYLILLYT